MLWLSEKQFCLLVKCKFARCNFFFTDNICFFLFFFVLVDLKTKALVLKIFTTCVMDCGTRIYWNEQRNIVLAGKFFKFSVCLFYCAPAACQLHTTKKNTIYQRWCWRRGEKSGAVGVFFYLIYQKNPQPFNFLLQKQQQQQLLFSSTFFVNVLRVFCRRQTQCFRFLNFPFVVLAGGRFPPLQPLQHHRRC